MSVNKFRANSGYYEYQKWRNEGVLAQLISGAERRDRNGVVL